MNRKKVTAGVLALAIVFAGSAPMLQNAGFSEMLTAEAMDAAVESKWDCKEYYEVGDFTIQFVQAGYLQIIKMQQAGR